LNIDTSNANLDPLVNFWNCEGSSHKTWKYDFENEQVMSLTNTENPCLDVLMSIKEDGTPVQVQNCNLSKKQKWKVEEVECPDLSALLGTDPNESVDPNADPDSESGNTGTDTDNNTDANQNSGGTT
jgi:hypothetical protein